MAKEVLPVIPQTRISIQILKMDNTNRNVSDDELLMAKSKLLRKIKITDIIYEDEFFKLVTILNKAKNHADLESLNKYIDTMVNEEASSKAKRLEDLKQQEEKRLEDLKKQEEKQKERLARIEKKKLKINRLSEQIRHMAQKKGMDMGHIENQLAILKYPKGFNNLLAAVEQFQPMASPEEAPSTEPTSDKSYSILGLMNEISGLKENISLYEKQLISQGSAISNLEKENKLLASRLEALHRNHIDEQSDINELINVPLIFTDFEIFPHGEWEVSDIIRRLKSNVHNSNFIASSLDIQRIIAIQTLKPKNCYIGNKQWTGYIAFSFYGTENVILECPYEGNATYIIYGEWEKYVKGTRKELRENYPLKYTKCVHRGEWLEKVKDAMALTYQKVKTSLSQQKKPVTHLPKNINEALQMPLSGLKLIIENSLRKRPNQSCPEKSLIDFVLSDLNIRTSGNPRKNFQNLLTNATDSMVKSKVIKRYQTSKNIRLKLVQHS